MKLYKSLTIVLFSLSVVSCKYLDVVPDNVGTIEYVFRNRNEAEKYLFTCYSTLQKLNKPDYNGGFTTSGEIVFPNDLRDNRGMDEKGFNLVRGLQTTNDPSLNFWDGKNGGEPLFLALRQCNIMLENIDLPIDLNTAEKVRWVAEVKFLKAYYHFYLLRMYGPIPIMDVNIPIGSTAEEVRVKRKPVDEVVNYIVNLLDEAAPDLPAEINNPTLELGRITRVIALAVKADVLMTAASPLFNGNADYASFRGKDGEPMFNTQFDATKWDRAATACLEAIELAEQRGLVLHTFNAPANIPRNLPDSLHQVLTLQTAVTEKWELNKELIWALNSTFGRQEYAMPRLNAAAAGTLIAQGTFAVPIGQQELFYTDKGLPIDEDRTWDYSNRYKLKIAEAKDRFYVHQGYETVNAHFKREPRFYAAVGFDGGVWYGNGTFDPENAQYIQARGPGGFAAPKDGININISAYWPKKIVNYLTVYNREMTWENYRMPLIRLAGLYLWYAEALNEQGKAYGEVLPYVNKVRKRAGLPTVEESWGNYAIQAGKYTTQGGLREIIHRERRIELAFEGIAGWDLRRWKELQGVMSRPVLGWSIHESQPLNFYRQRVLFTPVFNQRDYLWPIKTDNLIVNTNLVQNPWW